MKVVAIVEYTRVRPYQVCTIVQKFSVKSVIQEQLLSQFQFKVFEIKKAEKLRQENFEL